MKSARFGPIFCAVALALLCPAAEGAATLQRVTISGHAYVRIRDWARRSGMTTAWVVRDKTLALAGHPTRIQITADSNQIRFDGTAVFLSYPVVKRDGGFYVAALDVDAVLEPLLNPPNLPTGKKIRTICLDPGHGGRDSGNLEGRQQEKRDTLLLAQELRDQLVKRGFHVVLTRSQDTFLDLDRRPELAKKAGADLFISVHFNSVASGKSNVQGAETYCLTPARASSTNARGIGAGSPAVPGNNQDEENICLAYQIQRSLVARLKTEDRGVRRARFAVLRDTQMPAVLVEAGFMSHPKEGAKIATAEYRRQIARALADGVAAYKNALERGT